jgi:hypothetical protein
VTRAADVTLELFGEGKTDIGKGEGMPVRPNTGVLPRLLHSLCDKPNNMLVKRGSVSFLMGKGWVQKVKFAKRQAFYNGSAGVVFVMDTEGELQQRMDELTEGRDAAFPEFPMAVGAPHPCIEVWLLADQAAIKKAMGLNHSPQPPEDLEGLPAPCQDRKRNPKTILAQCGGVTKSELTAEEKDRIAAEIRILERLQERCPLSFAPFAAEVRQRIRPLFAPAADSSSPTPDADSATQPAPADQGATPAMPDA